MSPVLTLELQIEQLKESLENAAVQHKYNFHHPSVLQISERLDELIVEAMKRRNDDLLN